MAERYVAIDLETTGFDPAVDHIIEVGAVRFGRTGRAERFSSFVRPNRGIPREVQALTGIRDVDLLSAPPLAAVLGELRAFAAGCVPVGHNVQFDLAFLDAGGLVLGPRSYDTFDLASVLLTGATRLQLAAVAGELGVAMPVAHRALADADAARAVFLRLLDRLDALPRAVLLDLLAVTEPLAWGLRELVGEAVERGGFGLPEGPGVLVPAPPASVARAFAPLEPREGAGGIDEGDVGALFAMLERRPELLPGYVARPTQQAVARAVARALTHQGQLAVEAGTGTGKTLAYLLPAALLALRRGERVVVATHTLNLQEQLVQRDLPAAAAAAEAVAGVPAGTLRGVILKGRANYLCLERWAEARATPRARTPAEARLQARIAVWLPGTETGELGEVAVPANERAAWDALAADGNDCLSRRCAYVREGTCFLLRARQRAAAAHVVVVNHALLLANASADEQVLPPFRQLVIDEAHRLEGVATQQYGARLALRELQGQLDGAAALCGRAREWTTGEAVALSPVAGLRNVADTAAAAATRAAARIPDLEATLRAACAELGEDRSARSGRGGSDRDERQLLVTAARRAQPAWGDVEDAALQLDVTLAHASERLDGLRGAIAALGPSVGPDAERVQGELGACAQALGGARTTIVQALLRAEAARIVWIEDGAGGVRVLSAPLEVADRLADELYAGRDAVIATSATLTAQGSFDFSVRALGLRDADTLAVPSPFDYRRAVLAIVAEDVPPPDAPGYAEAVHRAIARATEAAGGRTLALFTSHAAVRAAASGLYAQLLPAGINVLAQQLDGAPARLLRTLAEEPRTLLLGTAAFWEGVDVRGAALSQIAMARLPFPVPGEPVYAGRAALYDDPFEEFALPQAILRFRQGFGRLIRGDDERGVFLLLDQRVLTRPYGQAFLDALPDCEVRRLPVAAIADAVARWLAR
ncbi:MAG: hypothetical protein EXR63_01120 [Dehalococcoidia bacterium]|nr:hypothetical protein [Dehalococcoidia bacterium]